MRTLVVMALISSLVHALPAIADDDASIAKTPQTTHSATVVATTDTTPDAARFTTDQQWEVAGYNMEEIIYTISITSHDTRILRCRTHMEGHYLDNGTLAAISDEQTSTVFPDQQVRVGNWTGLDEKSGATFTVKCKAM